MHCSLRTIEAMSGYSIATYPVVSGGHLKSGKVIISTYQMIGGTPYVARMKRSREVNRLIGLPEKEMYKTNIHAMMRDLRNKELDRLSDIAEGVADHMDIGLGDSDEKGPRKNRVRISANQFAQLPSIIEVNGPTIEGMDNVVKMLPTRNSKEAVMIELSMKSLKYLYMLVQNDRQEFDESERPIPEPRENRPRGIVKPKYSKNRILCRWKGAGGRKQKTFKFDGEDKEVAEARALEFMQARECEDTE